MRPKLALVLFLLLLHAADHATAQETRALGRCDLHSPRDTSYTPTVERCLDVLDLQGRVYRVPHNVTRIDNDGLGICNRVTPDPDPVDIVFILDQSRTMYPAYVQISADGRDTTYLMDAWDPASGCRDTNAISTAGTAEIPYDDHTIEVEVITPGSDITGCRRAGDRYSQRSLAFMDAVNFQYFDRPDSRAGYIGYAGSIVQSQPIVRLDTGIGLVQGAMIEMHPTGGKRLTEPLRQAEAWLSDPAMAPSSRKGIVLLTDRPPDDVATMFEPLEGGYFPPIFTIQIGPIGEPVDESQLRALSSRTGGRHFRVSPARMDSVHRIMQAILGQLIYTYIPIEAHLYNDANGQESRAGKGQFMPGEFEVQTNRTWTMHLDSNLALAEGDNPLRIRITYVDTLLRDTITDLVGFGMDVSSPPLLERFEEVDTIFAATCFDPSRLEIRNAAFDPVQSLTDLDSAMTLRLTTERINSSTIRFTTESQIGQDGEALVVDTAGAYHDDSARFTHYRAGLPLRVGTRVLPGDGILQTAAFDSAIAFWRDSRDPRDSARAAVSVRVRARLTMTADSAAPDRARVRLDDPSPDPSGDDVRTVILSAPGGAAQELVLVRVSDGVYEGGFTTAGWVPESRERVTISGMYGDPVFPDTASAQVVLVAPWFPAKVSFDREEYHVVENPVVSLVVEDRDPDTASAQVRFVLVGGHRVRVVETGAATNVFVGEARLDTLVPGWASKPPEATEPIIARYEDPLHAGDIAFDTARLHGSLRPRDIAVVPQRSRGPYGTAELVAHDWNQSAGELTVVVGHRNGSRIAVVLRATDPWTYRGTFAFAQGPEGDPGSLQMGRPADPRIDSFAAALPERGPWPEVGAMGYVERPPFSLAFDASKDDSWTTRRRLVLTGGSGATRDAREREGRMSSPGAQVRGVVLTESGPGVHAGFVDSLGWLPESPRSVEFQAWFVDPVYGDTARATLSVKPPWYPSALAFDRPLYDARQGGSAIATLRDKDPDPSKVGTAVIVVGGRGYRAGETGPSTGVYTAAVPLREIDSNWIDRPWGTTWTVPASYTDPLHPEDVSRAKVALFASTRPPELSIHNALARYPAEPRRVVPPGEPSWQLQARRKGDGEFDVLALSGFGEWSRFGAPGAARNICPEDRQCQGVELRIYGPVTMYLYVYDNLGTFLTRQDLHISVADWNGWLRPYKDGEASVRLYALWNHRGAGGELAQPGLYVIRAFYRDPLEPLGRPQYDRQDVLKFGIAE